MKTTAIVGLALLALAACGESATAPATVGPRFNGGGTYGGGLAVSPPLDGTTASTDGTGTECVERGGGTYGGGLYTQPVCAEP